MNKKLLTKLAALAKARLALETDLLAYYEACGVLFLSDKTKQLVIEHSKKRIAFDSKVIALIEDGLLTKVLHNELSAERIKMDRDYCSALDAAGLSEVDRATLAKPSTDILEREQALEALRVVVRKAIAEENGD